ncbi:MAG: hypothetical protein ACRD4S_11845 [Candidatus Acidiferrales bacterium]
MGAVENIKEVADLVKKFNDIDLNRRILKLEEEVIDLSREKRRLDDKVEELERSLRFKGEIEFKEPFYWLKNDQVPYCPVCWEGKNKAVHVTYSHRNNYGEYWDCKACGAKYTTHGIRK